MAQSSVCISNMRVLELPFTGFLLPAATESSLRHLAPGSSLIEETGRNLVSCIFTFQGIVH